MSFRKLINAFLGWSRYHVARIDDCEFFASLLHRHLRPGNPFFYVQIGANDGISYDPIYPFLRKYRRTMRGIVVEPMKEAFDLLCRNYRKFPEIKKVNAAIHNSEKELTLYKVDPEKLGSLPNWARGIASLNKDHHKISKTPSDCIITESVKAMTLTELLDKHGVEKLDLLQIDTEGYDAEIILNADFNRIRPGILHFEHGLKQGIMSRKTIQKVVDHLNRNGYQVVIEKYDATAYPLAPFLPA